MCETILRDTKSFNLKSNDLLFLWGGGPLYFDILDLKKVHFNLFFDRRIDEHKSLIKYFFDGCIDGAIDDWSGKVLQIHIFLR